MFFLIFRCLMRWREWNPVQAWSLKILFLLKGISFMQMMKMGQSSSTLKLYPMEVCWFVFCFQFRYVLIFDAAQYCLNCLEDNHGHKSLFSGPQESEEEFGLTLTKVTGLASIDDSASTFTIIIEKKGHPNGLFVIPGRIEPSASITEPENGTQLVRIEVQRLRGSAGVVQVN